MQKVSKIEAARRQLDTAIELWFYEKDAVSIHTLAYASYEVIHALSKPKRNRSLLWDSVHVDDRFRKEFAISTKKHANFFKHSEKQDNSPEITIEFKPELSEGFMIFSLIGVECLGIKQNSIELAFIWWHSLNNPLLFKDEGGKKLTEQLPIQTINDLRMLTKYEFFDAFLLARSQRGFTD